MNPMRQTPLVLPLVAYLRAAARVRRVLDRGDRLAGGFLSAALSTDERSALGIHLYDVSPAHRGTGLQPWEEAWLRRRLPPPPARLFVGGCGAGRELVALAASGYALDACEPAASLCATARARLGDQARVVGCSYEDLSAAILDGADNAAAPLAAARYDAVLLGWGSLTHVLDGGERVRLMRALDRLCPRGPILASFWSERFDRAPSADRAYRLGAAAGRAVAALRKLPGAPASELFTLHAGFAHRFTRDEIDALAASVGRAVHWDDDDTDYPHVTFARG